MPDTLDLVGVTMIIGIMFALIVGQILGGVVFAVITAFSHAL